MRRFLCWLCLCVLLTTPAWAQEEEGGKYLALTFDDGPSGRFTSALLEGLAEREVHATFFLCGYRVDQYPTLAAEIAQGGHEIGLHGNAHRFFTEMGPQEVCTDLSTAREKLLAATGQSPTLMRPPGGLYDLEVLKKTDCADLPIVLWSVDPQDWCCSDSGKIAARVIQKAKNGDIILMHDMSTSSVQAAFQIIDTLEDRGFEFVTVSELAYLAGTEMKGTEAYYSFSLDEKNASISERVAATEPCAKLGFPPPRPRKAALRDLTRPRRSPFRQPRAYL